MILALETATRRVGVAIGDADGLLGSVELGGTAHQKVPRHTEQLVPAIQFLCLQVGVELQGLTAVAVGIGPGMFTGLRVGVVTAKTIAHALHVPVVALSSLDLLAHPLRLAKQELICPVIDARRNEVYFALYRSAADGVRRVSDYAIGSADDVVAEVAARGANALVCGDGAVRFAEVFGSHELMSFAGVGNSAPSLDALVELASTRLARGEVCAAAEVAPMYLRKSDAEITADRRTRAPAGSGG